jgi:hypothetical protein
VRRRQRHTHGVCRACQRRLSLTLLDGRGFCGWPQCQARESVLMARAFRNAEKVKVEPSLPIPAKHLPEPNVVRPTAPHRTPSQERALRAAAERIVRSTPW